MYPEAVTVQSGKDPNPTFFIWRALHRQEYQLRPADPLGVATYTTVTAYTTVTMIPTITNAVAVKSNSIERSVHGVGYVNIQA